MASTTTVTHRDRMQDWHEGVERSFLKKVEQHTKTAEKLETEGQCSVVPRARIVGLHAVALLRTIALEPLFPVRNIASLERASKAREATETDEERRKSKIREALTPKGLCTRICFLGEGDNLWGRVDGYRFDQQLWAPAPYVKEKTVKVKKTSSSPNFQIPQVRGKNSGSLLIGGERIYSDHRTSDGVVFSMVPLNGGYVPARHGGDPDTGNWLQGRVTRILYDSHGVRHPAWPGFDYQQHGCDLVEDWRGRECWCPSKIKDLVKAPEKVPATRTSPLYHRKIFPKVTLPKTDHDAEAVARAVGLGVDCALGRLSNTAQHTTQFVKYFSGELEKTDAYVRAETERREKTTQNKERLAQQKAHSDQMANALEAEFHEISRYAHHPEIQLAAKKEQISLRSFRGRMQAESKAQEAKARAAREVQAAARAQQESAESWVKLNT